MEIHNIKLMEIKKEMNFEEALKISPYFPLIQQLSTASLGQCMAKNPVLFKEFMSLISSGVIPTLSSKQVFKLLYSDEFTQYINSLIESIFGQEEAKNS